MPTAASGSPGSEPTGGPVARRFDPPESPGEVGRFGKYRVLKELGAGGMGAVFEAEDTILGRAVALKFLAPALAAKPENRERFLREARAAFRVRSDHVIEVFEADERNGQPYFAMERLRGESLDDYLDRKGSPSPAAVLRIGRGIAEGLAAAHAAGLVHRDVKPSNVWLEAPGGRPKLIDFGLAHMDWQNTRLTASGQIVGTPEYMAPEQAGGRGVDSRADLFGLGVVLYRLTTGVRPFARGSVMASLAAVLTTDPPPPAAVDPRVPAALSDLILGLLAKDPAARPPGARWVADALGRMAAAMSQTESSASPVSAAGDPAARFDTAGSGSRPVPLSHPGLPAPEWRPADGTTTPATRSPHTPIRGNGWLKAAGLGASLLAVLLVLVATVSFAARGRKPANDTGPGVAAATVVARTERAIPIATAASRPTPTPTAPPTMAPPTMAPLTKTPPAVPARPDPTPKTIPAKTAPAPLKAPFSSAEARAAQAAWAAYLNRDVVETLDLPDGVKLDVVLIPPGAFTMGSPGAEATRLPDEVQHPVEIAKPFYLGKYEVTQAQYRAVMKADPSKFKGDRLPVETVSHADAEEFCRKASVNGRRLVLPAEAQWEYACRAGTTTPFHFGPALNGGQACCNGGFPFGTTVKGEYLGRTSRVGRYPANAFGLHDMHGNVYEWCRDWYGPYTAVWDPEEGQTRKQADDLRILRGGCWFDGGRRSRAADRARSSPNARSERYGFRAAVRLD